MKQLLTTLFSLLLCGTIATAGNASLFDVDFDEVAAELAELTSLQEYIGLHHLTYSELANQKDNDLTFDGNLYDMLYPYQATDGGQTFLGVCLIVIAAAIMAVGAWYVQEGTAGDTSFAGGFIVVGGIVVLVVGILVVYRSTVRWRD